MKVLCVHGYLAPKAIFWPLAHRLKQRGMDAVLFGYSSHRGTLKEHGDALAKAVLACGPEPTYIVAHSLGGLVTKQALTDHALKVERIVFIATPHGGSARSRFFRRTPISRLLSDAVKRTATSQFPNFSHPCVGVITGKRDKMVTSEEGYTPIAKEQVNLPYGHNDILVRPRTASLVARFLCTGMFDAGESLSFLRHQSEMS